MNKLTQFLEHPYTAADSNSTTRNFLYDSYPGVRIGSTGTWLNGVAPTITEYVPGTGIIHTRRVVSNVQLDEYDFTPQGLTRNASFMLVEATQLGTSGPVDAYALFNYMLRLRRAHAQRRQRVYITLRRLARHVLRERRRGT